MDYADQAINELEANIEAAEQRSAMVDERTNAEMCVLSAIELQYALERIDYSSIDTRMKLGEVENLAQDILLWINGIAKGIDSPATDIEKMLYRLIWLLHRENVDENME